MIIVQQLHLSQLQLQEEKILHQWALIDRSVAILVLIQQPRQQPVGVNCTTSHERAPQLALSHLASLYT